MENNRKLDLPLDLFLSVSVSALAKAHLSGDTETREDTPPAEPSLSFILLTAGHPTPRHIIVIFRMRSDSHFTNLRNEVQIN